MKNQPHVKLEPVFADALWLAAKRRETSRGRLLREIAVNADIELGFNSAVRCWLLQDALHELAEERAKNAQLVPA